MKPLTQPSSVELQWGIRASLLSYMARDAGFTADATGGAEFTVDSGVRMHGRVDDEGVLRFDGAVVLRAHHGALCVPLVGVEIAAGALTVEDPADEDESPGRLTLVRLDQEEEEAGGFRAFATRLAPEADSLFLYNYLPDSPFAPLRLRFSAA